MHIPSVRSSVLRLSLLTASFLPPSFMRAQSPPGEAALSQTQLEARDALNQGVAAFKNAEFDEAVSLFQRAKQLDPSLENAGLYLATAYASQYIPGAPSEENRQKADLARDEYKRVLDRNPTNLSAIDGLASILYQTAGMPFSVETFEESKNYHKKHIALKPDDPQPYYSVGVIDWALSYRANTQLRSGFNQSVGVRPETTTSDDDEDAKDVREEAKQPTGLRDTDPLPEVIRQKYAEDYGPTIDEGIAALKRAIELNPDYDDAMTYLNLLYRRKADVVATAIERSAWVEQADELLDKVRSIKQKRFPELQR